MFVPLCRWERGRWRDPKDHPPGFGGGSCWPSVVGNQGAPFPEGGPSLFTMDLRGGCGGPPLASVRARTFTRRRSSGLLDGRGGADQSFSDTSTNNLIVQYFLNPDDKLWVEPDS